MTARIPNKRVKPAMIREAVDQLVCAYGIEESYAYLEKILKETNTKIETLSVYKAKKAIEDMAKLNKKYQRR